jgi:LysR family transcriptional regulator, glycine cleavage system transcriptional activator
MLDPLASIPLSAIRVFEAAARLKSFTQAAHELGMTQAAVSWQIKALERRLEQPLFRRLPREVALTPAGERLARAAVEAVTALRSALSDISESGEGVLAISTLQTFAAQWLAGRLGAFQLSHPQIAVRLSSEPRLVDLMQGEADVAVRVSPHGNWPGLEALCLFPAAQTALVSADVMAGLEPMDSPLALLSASLIGSEDEWAEWFAAAGVTGATPATSAVLRLVADTQTLEMAAVLTAGGAAMASPVMFAGDIMAGRLVQPFDAYIDTGRHYWLVYPLERRRSRKIAAFRDWLLDQVAKDPAALCLSERLPGGKLGEAAEAAS